MIYTILINFTCIYVNTHPSSFLLFSCHIMATQPPIKLGMPSIIISHSDTDLHLWAASPLLLWNQPHIPVLHSIYQKLDLWKYYKDDLNIQSDGAKHFRAHTIFLSLSYVCIPHHGLNSVSDGLCSIKTQFCVGKCAPHTIVYIWLKWYLICWLCALNRLYTCCVHVL